MNDIIVDKFDDIQVLRYEVPAFEKLSLQEKLFVYYLSHAAVAGRDILWDQNCRYNLKIRDLLERILSTYDGDRNCKDFKNFTVYAKKVFFANGIHHHYSSLKFKPLFSREYFRMLLVAIGEEDSFNELDKVIFDAEYMPQRVVSGGDGDLVLASANNFYQGVTMNEALNFYAQKPKEETPESYGLNSTLVKDLGKIEEKKWCIGGKYSREIAGIVHWLEKARDYAGNKKQEEAIDLLVEYYKTGDLKTFDKYSITWVQENEAPIDFINGFIEVYGDAIGLRGSWESVVEIVDKEACIRTETLAKNAQWFEDHAPIDDRFKKTEVSGVSARVMQVAMLGGDSYPATPIGINLPNSEWIRERYGSKSVTLDNITDAYHIASLGSGVLDEFTSTEKERERARTYGTLGGNLHTDLHECLGHGSGKMLPGITVSVLKNYYSVLEEARADLFALYYIGDAKLIELGLIPSLETAYCEYDGYMRNGLMVQLTRIKLGENLEEAHMRNRQMIAAWVYEKGKADKVVEIKKIKGKTYVVVNDYEKLRTLFGNLLAEVQRIKSEGDFNAARDLVETYGIKIDQTLHAEVLERYARLNVPPFSGFINPEYELIEAKGKVIDVKVSYPKDYLQQMMEYGKNSYLNI